MSENRGSSGGKRNTKKQNRQRNQSEAKADTPKKEILQNETDQLQMENEELKKKNNLLETECSNLKDKLHNLETEIRELKNQIKQREFQPKLKMEIDSEGATSSLNVEKAGGGGGENWYDTSKIGAEAAMYSDGATKSIDWGRSQNYSSGRTWGQSSNNDYRGRGQERNSGVSHPGNSKLAFLEKDGNLFEAPKSNSLAHCVAEDLKMGSGIAVTFRQDFKRIDDLLDQKKKVGDVAILEDDGRFIYYLITKKHSSGKPFIKDLERSLYAMKKHCVENCVREVAMPRIGCGLDRLKWREVRDLLYTVFADLNITITIYNFTEEVSERTSQERTSSAKKVFIKEETMNLVDIEAETVLVYFGSVNGDANRTILELNKKHAFLADYQAAPKKVGDILQTWKKSELLIGLIVKEKESDNLSFKILKECLRKVRNLFQKNKDYHYLGLEAFEDENDDMIMPKIVTLLIDVFFNVKSEVWICWPPALRNLQPAFNQNC